MRNFCLCLLLLCFTLSSRAGIVIGGTRFIYQEGQPSLGVTLRNTSTRPWLVNTHIYTNGQWAGTIAPMAKQNPLTFSAIPPLFTLRSGGENALRIIQVDPNLPKDRESLFTLSIAAIPSGHSDGNSVQMAVRSGLKLIYRPSGLKGKGEKAWQQLKWTQAGKALQVANPTPYYVTLFNLKINGKIQPDAGVVAPFSQRKVEGCAQSAGCQIQWQTLNDYGKVMPAVTASLGRG
ncbi:MAG: fimbria/pilus periplasmic chaperone [Scandinavium sp.]|uniref:fimbria/pilus periplasmic chaperone n=1 Tax=Scandinavium sp. TaxID=2830653 RepID=UPI003F3206B4